MEPFDIDFRLGWFHNVLVNDSVYGDYTCMHKLVFISLCLPVLALVTEIVQRIYIFSYRNSSTLLP